METKIYLCSYTDFTTVFSRHFITGISQCREIGSMPISELQFILNTRDFEAMIRQRELIVTSKNLILKILEKTLRSPLELSGNEYVLIRITQPHTESSQ